VRRTARVLALAVALIAGAQSALAARKNLDAEPALGPDDRPHAAWIFATIDISDQTMLVYVDGTLTYTFPVSTARRGYVTPVGFYGAQWLSPKHRSRKYDNAPMPWAVFFHGGYAVHGTTEIRKLGKPASHGCVRLHPDNAKTFFSLVKDAGVSQAQIAVVD
jgi:lipoprotein-anchoring transpeptidase ErfK/SrfK